MERLLWIRLGKKCYNRYHALLNEYYGSYFFHILASLLNKASIHIVECMMIAIQSDNFCNKSLPCVPPLCVVVPDRSNAEGTQFHVKGFCLGQLLGIGVHIYRK